jgi:WD40 repeat protein
MTTFASRTRATVVILFGWVIATTPVLASPQSAHQDPGDELWVSRYDGPDGTDDTAVAVAASPDGARVFVAGSVNKADDRTDFGALAYDALTGDQLWETTLGTTENDYVSSIAVSPQGERIYVVGEGDRDYLTVALDVATGAELWSSAYDFAGSTDAAYSVEVSPDGARLFVTGNSASTDRAGYDFATLAYEASTGERLWASRYHGGASREDWADDIGVSPDGSSVFVTGHSQEDRASNDLVTAAYDALTGDELWVTRFQRGTNDYGKALDVSPDGSRVFVAGYSDEVYVTVSFDSETGALRWVRRNTRGHIPNDLVVSPDGSRVFLTGYSEALPNDAFVTVAHDPASGAVLWSSRYDGPGRGADFAHSIGVSSDGGTVYVTGESDERAEDTDYATVAYDALTGVQLWASRYEGGGFDAALSLTVAPDGASVFVTGYSTGGGTGLDFATVAYSA